MEEIERKDASFSYLENDFNKDGDHYGDNSDGKINWTKTQTIAVMSLSTLWVRISPLIYVISKYSLTHL
jgi:hypothetical protein